jgi:peptidyl-prolyl cis-trans isomerase B (cyclophilin B)
MMTATFTMITVLFSVLMPQKMWYAPAQPLNFTIKSDKDATLELTDFSGKVIAAKGSADVSAGQTVDVKSVFPDTANPGTFVLYAVPKGAATAGPPKDFLGTPAVIEVLSDSQQNPQATVVTHVVPLQYVVMNTDDGAMTEVFYYDSAPHTVANFLDLAAGGFYDGLTFHRVAPGFVIQGGDPLGNGSGGPGYSVGAEFNNRPHQEGVLSMARASDPNSAGSQFFICLDYTNTQQLDHQYTAFGKVVAGMEAVKKIASAPGSGEKPDHPAAMTTVQVLPVTAANNPYAAMMAGQ